MLDSEQDPTSQTTDAPAAEPTEGESPAPRRRRGRASRPSGPPAAEPSAAEQPAAEAVAEAATTVAESGATGAGAEPAAADAEPAPAKPVRRRRTTKTAAAAEPPATTEPSAAPAESLATGAVPSHVGTGADEAAADESATRPVGVAPVLFQAPEPVVAPPRRRRRPAAAEADATDAAAEAAADDSADATAAGEGETGGDEAEGTASRNRRRRGRRGRGRSGEGGEGAEAADGNEPAAEADQSAAEDTSAADTGDDEGQDEDGDTAARRRRRRRRRGGGGGGGGGDNAADQEDPPNTVVHVREPRPQRSREESESDVRGVKGSTRLEAKRQRRREGRDSGRRRPPVLTEAEFLARREAVDRVMVVRQGEDRTQIAVLEDGVLVEHYVARKDASSMVGNVYLGKVQNVLPSMEAAFVDIGRGRNAVLYAGEVNYDASMLEGKPARIEQALKSGQSVLVQVTKDPIGHKGARLTSQVSVPGRYMVYVPDGRVSGISRKLPDTERTRLKGILKRLMPEEAGVIIRTAAEGASEDDLERDLKRLHAQWEDIAKKAKTASAPSLIYGEPDIVIRVVRDIFNEDFTSLVVQGDDEWDTVDNYIRWVAPDLAERTKRWTEDGDVFEAYRIDEQLAKALDRKVWLPSGGSLIIDRTEAMVVIDVNTGKFTGKGGTLEQTVTKNNLEAAEEIVRQLRLRDLGGIIVIDFIDMVLESNRELVLRRLTECLGRDRTRHQVAEVTSLGLVQMTRKRVGQGLTEAFSHVCKECGGSGIIIEHDPVAPRRKKGSAKPKPVEAAIEAAAPDAPAEAPAEEPAEAESRAG